MSATSTIVLERDNATPALARLMAALEPRQLRDAVGPRAQRCVQRHLRTLGTNKRGWPSTQFWARAVRATRWEDHESGVLVIVDQVGVRQRWLGGTIKPQDKQALTIPISPVSYGRTAADFPGLFLLKTPKGAYLVQRDTDAGGSETKTRYGKRAAWMGGNARRRIRAQLNFLFKLVSSVNQVGDANVMPDEDELGAEAIQAVRERAGRLS